MSVYRLINMTTIRARGVKQRTSGAAMAVTAYVPLEMGQQLKRTALEAGESVTAFVSRAIKRELSNHRHGDLT